MEAVEVKVNHEVKIVVLGDPEVGKSSIVSKFCEDKFAENYNATVGSEYDSRIIQLDGVYVRVHLTDVSGQNHFLRLNTNNIRDADGYVFVYDVTSPESFESQKDWLRVVNTYAKNTRLPKILVGNKSDLRHLQKVEPAKAKEWGIPEGMSHIEVSARLGKYLNVAFHVLTSDILRFRQLGTVKVIGDHQVPTLVLPPETEEFLPIPCIQHVPNSPEYSHLFKIMLVGSSRVGKTALRYRFCEDCFCTDYYETCGFDYSTKTVVVDGTRIKLQLWDMSGDDMWNQTRRNYYKGANGFLIVYDVTSRESFTRAEQTLKELDMCGAQSAPKILIGNKVDLKAKKRVEFSTAKDFADGWRVPVVETSASSGLNIDLAMMKLLLALKQEMAPWKRIYNFS